MYDRFVKISRATRSQALQLEIMKLPSVAVIFNRRKTATKTKAAPVEIRVTHRRKQYYFPTGVSVRLGEWREGKGAIKRLDIIELNKRIASVRSSIEGFINDSIINGTEFTVDNLKKHLGTWTDPNSFLNFMELRINSRDDIRQTTRIGHQTVLNILKEYGKISTFADLTAVNIRNLDEWLRKRYKNQSSVRARHAVVKTYIHEAIREELITHDPYISIKIPKGKSVKRKYLTEKDLSRLADLKLVKKAEIIARDLFMFQCHTGLAYTDLMEFDFSDVIERNGKYIIADSRHKTGEGFYLVLLTPAVEILKRYKFKLPRVNLVDYNYRLQVLGEKINLPVRMSSHMGRHTFAVYAINNGIPIEVLARMMGHADIKTTQVYAKIVDNTVESAFDRLDSSWAKSKR